MSSYPRLYIGPLIVCNNLMISDDYITETYCSNNKCRKYYVNTEDKFCSECGKKIESEKLSTTKPTVDSFIITDETKEAFICVDIENKELNIDILIPNKKIKEITRETNFLPNNQDFCCIWTTFNIDEEKLNMCYQFKEEIEIIKKLYGENNVTISWGIVNYFI